MYDPHLLKAMREQEELSFVINEMANKEYQEQERTKRRIMLVMILFALLCFFLGVIFDHYAPAIDRLTALQPLATTTVRTDHIQLDIEPTPIPGQR